MSGPAGEASGLERRRILGGSGSAKGLLMSILFSRMGLMDSCEETLPFFFRNTFLSLFLLDLLAGRLAYEKSPGA